MARNGEALEGDACDVDGLPAAQQVLGRVRPSGNTGRRELRKTLQALALPFRHPHFGAGSLGKVGDAAKVVEVPVRDENCGAGRVEPRELQAELRRVAARIDHRALRRAALTPHDVTVRLKRTERVSVHCERHRGESSGPLVSRPGVREEPGGATLEPARDRAAQRHAVARRLNRPAETGMVASVSVIIPARNEAGNIEGAIQRLPKMGPNDELIFVEGNSTDATWERIVEMKQKYEASRKICAERQTGTGKGDAVRRGFAMARNDILMVLDADLTTPPEELVRFYAAIVSDKGEFINGSRLVYPMEKQAMRYLNMVANKFFALMFSFVLGQRFKDTLCGTKALRRENYLKLAAHREFFGDFDPFGDFDLIFGAARMGLRIIEVPIHYCGRTYGETNIQRWKHGAILLRMLLFAARRIKFI